VFPDFSFSISNWLEDNDFCFIVWQLICL
jgi:hypothetical protein